MSKPILVVSYSASEFMYYVMDEHAKGRAFKWLMWKPSKIFIESTDPSQPDQEYVCIESPDQMDGVQAKAVLYTHGAHKLSRIEEIKQKESQVLREVE